MFAPATALVSAAVTSAVADGGCGWTAGYAGQVYDELPTALPAVAVETRALTTATVTRGLGASRPGNVGGEVAGTVTLSLLLASPRMAVEGVAFSGPAGADDALALLIGSLARRGFQIGRAATAEVVYGDRDVFLTSLEVRRTVALAFHPTEA